MFNTLGVLLITTMMSFPFPGKTWKVIRVGLYNNTPVEQVVFTPVRGSYEIIGNGAWLGQLGEGDLLYVSYSDTAITIMQKGKPWARLDSVRLITNREGHRFLLRPVGRNLEPRVYPGNCLLGPGAGGLLMVNEVPENYYLAGVLLAEGGAAAPKEYYKAQAILARTFLAANPHRHASEGFLVCDETHCQVYHGVDIPDKIIMQAVRQTRHFIVADRQGHPIQPAYHSNSGGETAAAEKVWLKKVPWLITLNDPYSKKGAHYRWSREIPLKAWRSWLAQQGVPEDVPASRLSSLQNHRTYIYRAGNRNIPLQKIRDDWHLPSAFFSVRVMDDKVVLDGKGYGHGLGLSQEGAMEMAREGYSCKKIIRFYYPGTVLKKEKNK